MDIFHFVITKLKAGLVAALSVPKLISGLAIVALAALGAAAVLMNGRSDYNAQGIVLIFFRLNLLLLWSWFSGWILDRANGVKFEEDRKLIETDNVAVALGRAIGFLALVISGALLIQRV